MSVRSRIGIGIGMCAMISLLGGNATFAEEPPTPAESLWKTAGFQISGAVLTSYTQNFNLPATNNNQLRIFDTGANSFMANLAQIVFERPATAGSAMDRVGFRARLNFGTDARFSRARSNFQPGTDNNELDVQEMYGEYIVPIGNGLKIQFGKMNTLIGYEVVNAWENPNFSRTMMFGLSQAFTETGVRFIYPFNDMVTATVGIINGWDNLEDTNRGKTVTWLLAVEPHKKFGVNVFGSYGSEQPNGNAAAGAALVGVCANGATGCDPTAKRLVVGGIITIKPTDMDTLILEPYYGNESNASTTSGHGNARWNGFVTYFIHDFNDQEQPNAFSLRARGEIWEDAGGSRACAGGVNFNGGANTCAGSGSGQAANGAFFAPPINAFVAGNGLTAWETTVTLQYKPVPALQTRVEYRYDHADQNAYLKGTRAVNHSNTLAFSVAYIF